MSPTKPPDEIEAQRAAARDDIAKADAQLRKDLPAHELKYHRLQRHLAIARLWSLGATRRTDKAET